VSTEVAIAENKKAIQGMEHHSELYLLSKTLVNVVMLEFLKEDGRMSI
jgi:hypothetical protein